MPSYVLLLNTGSSTHSRVYYLWVEALLQNGPELSPPKCLIRGFARLSLYTGAAASHADGRMHIDS